VWLYEYLAGIRPASDTDGFKKIVIRPYPVSGLDTVTASHESIYGKIASHWVRRNGGIQLDVTIPPNTSATVYVPSKDPASVKEAGGVRPERTEAGAAVFTLGSGSYSFSGTE
jgi:alpha-L-rhamnosidase